MTFFNRLIAVIALIAITTAFAGDGAKCDSKGKDADCKAANDNKKSSSMEDEKVEDPTIAAKAGDITITIDEVEKAVEPQMQNMPEEVQDKQKDQIKKRALDSLLFQNLLEKKFEEHDITISEKELNAEIEKILAENDITIDEFKKRVAEMGRDYEEFEGQVRNGLKYQKMMEKMGGGQKEVTDEQAAKYYEDNPQEFQQEPQVKASHILVKFAQDASEEEKAEAKSKIEGLLKQLKEGEDFTELAKAESDCPSGENGGDLGFFTKDRMVKPFADKAFSMDTGEVSDIVETQFGYHIIKVTDKKDAKTVSFEEAKEDIKSQLQNNERREFAGKFREELLEEADIVYYNEFKRKRSEKQNKPEQLQIQPAE